MSWKQHGGISIWRAIDLGFSPDPTYCLWIAHLGDRYIAFKERIWYKTIASQIAADIVEESEGLRISMTFCDPTMALQTAAGVRTIKDISEENGVPLEASINNRELYAHAIHTALVEETHDGTPRLQIYTPGCPYLVKSLPLMRADPKRPMALANHKHDHPAVTLAYFLISQGSHERRPMLQRIIRPWMRPKQKNDDRWILGGESVRDQH